MFRIAGDGQQGFRRGPEENAVNDLFVEKSDAGKLFRNGKDDMEILNRQQFCLPAFEPLYPLRVLAFRAMSVTAGVVGIARVIALAAFFGMPSERGGTADFDCAHDAQVRKRELAALTVSRAVLPENVGQLESRPEHGKVAASGSCPRGRVYSQAPPAEYTVVSG